MLAKSSKYYFISMGFVWCLFTSIYAIDISKWPTPSEILLQFPGVTEEYVQDHEIPMVLFKTGPTLTCSNHKGLECLFMHNEITSGCKIVFFNDEESRKLVADYFPETYLEAYDKLVPKTYKADIFEHKSNEWMPRIGSHKAIEYSRNVVPARVLYKDNFFKIMVYILA